MDVVQIPDKVSDDAVMFIRHDDGTLPKRRRDGEFRALRDEEVTAIEAIVGETFAGVPTSP